jgi:hypothetical protein
LADDTAVEDIERRKQRGRAVTDVVMRHRSGRLSGILCKAAP